MKITPIAAATIVPAVLAGAVFSAVPLAEAAPAAPASTTAAVRQADGQARVAIEHLATPVHHTAAKPAQAASKRTPARHHAAAVAPRRHVATVTRPAAPAVPAASAMSATEAAFESCVAWRESSNTPTDPDGLFGILPSTWAELGYSGTAGQASVSVQKIAFNRLYQEYGVQPWAPSDGC